MSISLLERISKPINLSVWSDYILSFVKYEAFDNITEYTFSDNIPLPESKYKWIKDILDISQYMEEQFDHIYAT